MTTAEEDYARLKKKKKKPLTAEEDYARLKKSKSVQPPAITTTVAPHQPPVGNFDEMLKQYESIEQSSYGMKAPIDTFAEHQAKMANMNPLLNPGQQTLSTAGLYPVRYVGGVIGRAAETFEQSVLYLAAKGYQTFSSYKPQFPEGYNTSHMWGRVFQPGKFYRLDEKILTQNDWDTPKGAAINFTTAVAIDPLTWAGVKPSKLALGKKTMGGLSAGIGDANVVEKYITKTVPSRLQMVKDIAESMRGTPEGEVVAQHLANVAPDVEQAMKTPHIVDIKRLARVEEDALKQLNSTLKPEFRAAQEPLIRSALETARGNVDPMFMEVAELYPQLKNPQLAHGATMKFLSRAADSEELLNRAKYLGADDKFLKNKYVKEIFKFAEKNPDKIKQILDDSVRMSEKMKSGAHSYVIGPGAGFGFYKLSWEGDPLAKLRPAMAASLNAMEELTSNWDLGRMLGGISKNGKMLKMPLDPLIVKPLYEIDKVTGETHVVGGDIVGNIDMNIKRMRHAQRAAVIETYFNFQEDVHTQIFEPMKELGLNPRDVFEYAETGAEKFVAKHGMEHAVGVEPFAGILRRKFDETAIQRMGYKDFSMLSNYITRVAVKNDKGVSALDAFIRWRFQNTDEALRRNGMYGQLIKRRFTNPSMRVTSVHDMARSRGVPRWLQNEIRLNKYLREIESRKGNTEMVAKLDADAVFAERMAMDFTPEEKGGRGLFHAEMGPITSNEAWINEYGQELNDFVQSSDGIRWGFPAGSTADSFRVYSEDPEHVLSTYAKGYSQSKASGEMFDNWMRDFGIDPSKYELANNLAKLGRDLEKEVMRSERIYERATKALDRKLMKATGKTNLAEEIEATGKSRRNYLRLKQQMLKKQVKEGEHRQQYGEKIINWQLDALDKGTEKLSKAAALEGKVTELQGKALEIAKQIVVTTETVGGKKTSFGIDLVETTEKVTKPNPKLAELTAEIDRLTNEISTLKKDGDDLIKRGSAGVRIEKAEDITGKEQNILRVTKSKGEKLLSDAGFEQQPNKTYWKKGDAYAHFNSVDKTWHIEGDISGLTTAPAAADIAQGKGDINWDKMQGLVQAKYKHLGYEIPKTKEGRIKLYDELERAIKDTEEKMRVSPTADEDARLLRLQKDLKDFQIDMGTPDFIAEHNIKSPGADKYFTEKYPEIAIIKSPLIDTTVTDLIKEGNAKLTQAEQLEKMLVKIQTKAGKLPADIVEEVKRVETVTKPINEKAATLNTRANKLLKQAQEMREKGTYTPKQIQTIMDLGLKIKEEGQALKKEALAALTQNVKDYQYNERQLRKVKYLRRDGKAAFRTALKINEWREAAAASISENVEKAGAYFGKSVEMADDPTNELALALQEANRVGKKIVNVREWLDANKGEVAGADYLIGKLGKKADIFMDEDALIKMVEMAEAQRKIESPEWQSWFNHQQRFWVNNLLFVQLRTVYGNLWGDMWQRVLEGMEPRYATGMVGYQITAAEGEIIKGMPYGLSGLADNAVLDFDIMGKPIYAGQIRHEYKVMDVREGFYAGPVYQESDRFGFAKDKASQMGQAVQDFVKKPSIEAAREIPKTALPTAAKAVKSGGIPAVKRLYQMIEENGRISTYAWFRKQGYSQRDAYEKVMEVHFPYSEMNAKARTVFPFYFWNMKNPPRQLKYWMKKPALQQSGFKIGGAIDKAQEDRYDSGSSPRAEHLNGASVLTTFCKGKPIYFDYSNMYPPAAAEQVIGALNSDNPMDAVQQILENIGSMSGPGIKAAIEQIYNEKLFTHQPITDNAEDSRTGTSQFWGIDISGNRGAQRVAHIIDTFFPVPSSIIQLKKSADEMPKSLAVLKMAFGVPFRVDDPVLASYIASKKEIFPLKQRIKKLQEEYEKKYKIAPKEETDKIKDDIQAISQEMGYYQSIQSLSLTNLSVLKEIKYQIIIAKHRGETDKVKNLEAQKEKIYNDFKDQLKRGMNRGK